LSLKPPRHASTWSCVAEASQTAPDFIARGVKVETGGSDSPGNLLAEFFNAIPFIYEQLQRGPQVSNVLFRRLDLTKATGPHGLHRAGDVFRRLSDPIFCHRQNCVRRLFSNGEIQRHACLTRRSCLPPHE
jgi:hypothetical protein